MFCLMQGIALLIVQNKCQQIQKISISFFHLTKILKINTLSILKKQLTWELNHFLLHKFSYIGSVCFNLNIIVGRGFQFEVCIDI